MIDGQTRWDLPMGWACGTAFPAPQKTRALCAAGDSSAPRPRDADTRRSLRGASGRVLPPWEEARKRARRTRTPFHNGSVQRTVVPGTCALRPANRGRPLGGDGGVFLFFFLCFWTGGRVPSFPDGERGVSDGMQGQRLSGDSDGAESVMGGVCDEAESTVGRRQ